jgi:hypothetical protein
MPFDMMYTSETRDVWYHDASYRLFIATSTAWVWCEDSGGAGAKCRAGECWLKWQANPRAPAVMGHGTGTPWRAGSLAKSFTRAAVPVPAYTGGGDPGVVTLSWPTKDETVGGEGADGGAADSAVEQRHVIRIRLRPDWSPKSAAWARQAAGGNMCGPWCTFYRAEPVPDGWAKEGFYGPPYALLQGGLRPGPPVGRVVTPGSQIGYMDHTGCHQLNRVLTAK